MSSGCKGGIAEGLGSDFVLGLKLKGNRPARELDIPNKGKRRGEFFKKDLSGLG